MLCHGAWLSVSNLSSLGHFPLQLRSVIDECRVSVEMAGPVQAKTYMAKPDDIRGVADWLLNQCVFTEDGIGGFVTKDIDNMVDFVTAPQTNIYGSYRKVARHACYSP
jgi:hypothetical protein